MHDLSHPPGRSDDRESPATWSGWHANFWSLQGKNVDYRRDCFWTLVASIFFFVDSNSLTAIWDFTFSVLVIFVCKITQGTLYYVVNIFVGNHMENGWIADEDRRVKQNKTLNISQCLCIIRAHLVWHSRHVKSPALGQCYPSKCFSYSEIPWQETIQYKKEAADILIDSLWASGIEAIHVLGLKHIQTNPVTSAFIRKFPI